MVKAREESGVSTGQEGRLWRAQCPGAQAIVGGGGTGQRPQDSICDAHNSAGGGCEQGTSRAGHCQIRDGHQSGRERQALAFWHTCPRSQEFYFGGGFIWVALRE